MVSKVLLSQLTSSAKSIIRALTEDEIKRVEYYAPRVKRIQELCPLFPDRYQGYVICESSVLAAFAPRWSSGKALFPNLRILDVSPSNDQYPVYYRFFHVLFGPQLRRVSSDCTAFSHMTKDVPPADYQQMLVRLQESSPYLLHLQLNADVAPFSPIIVSAMSTAIRSFKHLVSVRTGSLPITEQAFRHLGELPHLEAINVRLPDTITEASFRRAHFGEIFPSLREVWLEHHLSLRLVSLMVQHIHSLQLDTIGAKLFDRVLVPVDDVMAFFSVVLSRNNAERIKELSVEASIEPTPESRFNEQHLEPLFALRSLVTLELHLRCTFDLDDAVLGRAAKAWPSIRVLDLGPGSVRSDTRVPTLAALVPFAQHCPELQKLGFALDADLSRVPSGLRDSERPGVAACVQRKLTLLKVGRARISDPRGVATFLLDVFPHLRSVDYGNSLMFFGAPDAHEDEAEAEWDDCWEAVCEHHLTAVARVRGIVRERTLDEYDAHVAKSWYMGPRPGYQ